MKKIFACFLIAITVMAVSPVASLAHINNPVVIYGFETKTAVKMKTDFGTIKLKKGTAIEKLGVNIGNKTLIWVRNSCLTGYILKSKIKKVAVMTCKCLSLE